MPQIHIDNISEARNKLKSLDQPKFVSTRQAVAALDSDIRLAISQGVSIKEISEVLQEQLPISKNTLRGYLYGKDRAVKEPTKKRRSA